MIWYGIIRFIIESMRTDSLMFGNIKMAQLISILMILIGIFTFFKFKNNIEYKSKGKENERNI
jgi:phosphatidylglycerol:prolipoprotein diacylglycerol transferase